MASVRFTLVAATIRTSVFCTLDEVEKEMIRKALDRHHGKRKNAAKDLNISERTLYRKIKEYGLD